MPRGSPRAGAETRSGEWGRPEGARSRYSLGGCLHEVLGCGTLYIMNFRRITIDPNVLNGQPCIRGMRIPVHQILDLLAAGQTADAILRAYPYLETDDIREAIAYGAWLAREETLPKTEQRR